MTKKILITGENSYVGNQLAAWMDKEPEKYEIIKKSVRNDEWKKINFSSFDVVVHVAGIAHQDTRADQEDMYYKVNTELTIELAIKAKNEGVSQFIFMSSMIVYGASSKIGELKVITKNTIPDPINFYGNSKLLAEKGILPLQSKTFNVVVIRPPMIYGKGSKGNYTILAKFAKKSPVFPYIYNQRSMLHIDNLCEFIRLLIVNEEVGMFFPQNKEYICTSDLVKSISKIHKKNTWFIKNTFSIMKILGKEVNLINKIFGNLTYEKTMSIYKDEYRVRDLKESIIYTEEVVK